jgi:type VI secretion system protein ImpL
MTLRRHLWWLVRVEVAVILVLAVWFGGQVEGYSENERLIAILVVMVVWGGWERLLASRDSPRTGEPETPESDAPPQTTRQAPLVRRRMAEGLASLRGLPIGRRGRYALPWYLVLGPHGAGKSALLANSGIAVVGRPPADEPTQAVNPIVTNEALFFDLAGTYVARSQLTRHEHAGWRALIGELVGKRRLLPLNGVIVALSPADLVLADATERAELAAGIRARLADLEQSLRLNLPIYVVLTKLDLTPGFVEYFDRLDVEQRLQAWGFSLSDGHSASQDGIEAFGPSFDALIEDLKRRQLDLLHRENDRRRAAMILGFPAQLASLKSVTEEVLNAVFQSGRARRPLLRGVYLTSARQDLLTIDRLMPAMADRFGLPPNAALPPDLSNEESAFGWFITRPLRESILAESGLVLHHKNPYRPRLAAHWAMGLATIALCALVGAGIASAFGNSLRQTRQIVVSLASATDRSGKSGLARDSEVLRTIVTLEPMVPQTFPPLPRVRALDPHHVERLDRAFGTAVHAVVERRVLPRIVGLVQARLIDPDTTGGALESAIRFYRVLGGISAPDAASLDRWLSADALALLPGESAEATSERRLLVDATRNELLGRRYVLGIDRDLLAAAEARVTYPGETR